MDASTSMLTVLLHLPIVILFSLSGMHFCEMSVAVTTALTFVKDLSFNCFLRYCVCVLLYLELCPAGREDLADGTRISWAAGTVGRKQTLPCPAGSVGMLSRHLL